MFSYIFFFRSFSNKKKTLYLDPFSFSKLVFQHRLFFCSCHSPATWRIPLLKKKMFFSSECSRFFFVLLENNLRHSKSWVPQALDVPVKKRDVCTATVDKFSYLISTTTCTNITQFDASFRLFQRESTWITSTLLTLPRQQYGLLYKNGFLFVSFCNCQHACILAVRLVNKNLTAEI